MHAVLVEETEKFCLLGFLLNQIQQTLLSTMVGANWASLFNSHSLVLIRKIYAWD